MINRQTLNDYSLSMQMLRKQCIEAGMSEAEFKRIYYEALNELQQERTTAVVPQESPKKRVTRRVNVVLLLALVMISLAIFALVSYNCSIILSNLQEFIYPGLHMLRRLAIPIVSLFPSLTGWYYETCLLANPFFTVVDMECWPCSSIGNVQELQEPVTTHQDYRAPFIFKVPTCLSLRQKHQDEQVKKIKSTGAISPGAVKLSKITLEEMKINTILWVIPQNLVYCSVTDQEVINWNILNNFYTRYKQTFDKEIPNVVTANNHIISASELFSKNYNRDDENPFIWKFNTMDTARLIRQLVPRPKVVPRFGQSTERFIFIDRSQSNKAFPLPDTECNYSFITALCGSRMLELRPAEECKHHCKSLKVELKETHLLWYNWWFYKPIIQPSNKNDTLIAHIGSYC